MANEFLLMKLDDKTRKAAEEIVKDLPEGMAQIITWADLEGMVLEAHQQSPEFLRLLQTEELGYIPEPDYGEIVDAARESWFRKPPKRGGSVAKGKMQFQHSRIG